MRLARCAAISVALLVSGCNDIEKACKGPCPDAAASVVQMRASMVERGRAGKWLEPTWVQTCKGGGTRIHAGDGLCVFDRYFAADGKLVFVEEGCEGKIDRFGDRRLCDVESQTDLLAEVKVALDAGTP